MDRSSFFEGMDRVRGAFLFRTEKEMTIAYLYKQYSSSQPFQLEDAPLRNVINLFLRGFPVVSPGVEPRPRPKMGWDEMAGLANILSARRVWTADTMKEHYALIGKAFEDGCQSDPNYRLILERMENDLNSNLNA